MTAPEGDVEKLLDVTLPPYPYPGLRPFEKDEWPIFFGRELVVGEVIERLIVRQCIALHGDSGCGKSSLVRAGVLPRLERDHARGGATWRTAAMLPRNAPLRNFASALASLEQTPPDPDRVTAFRRILNLGAKGALQLSKELRRNEHDYVCVLVDQFEEVFHFAERGGRSEAQQFVEVLVGLQTERAPGIHVVLTMRSEFLGSCAHFEGLAEIINDTQFLLPRMDHASMMRAIREPAELYGGEVSRELAATLIRDAGHGQDQLPLVQHALLLMQQRAAGAQRDPGKRWTLGLNDYAHSGGLARILSGHADRVASDIAQASLLGPARAEKIIERLYKALTSIDVEGRAIRRPQTMSELAAVTQTTREELIAFVAPMCRQGVSFLKISGEPPYSEDELVDISHEALIRNWDMLAGWVEAEKRDGLDYQRLAVLAGDSGSPGNILLGDEETRQRTAWWDALLPNAAWAERYGGGFDRVAQLLADSRAAKRMATRRKYVQRVLIPLSVLIFICAVGMLWLLVEALKQRTEANWQREAAHAAMKEIEKQQAVERELRLEAERKSIVADKARQDAEVARDESTRKESSANARLEKLAAELGLAQKALEATVVSATPSGSTFLPVDPGWLGADVQDVTQAEADKLGWESAHGAKVGTIAQGSPAANANLQTGDIILTLNGQEIDTASALNIALNTKQAGDQIRIRVLAAGKERRLTVTLAERPKVTAPEAAVHAADAGATPYLTLDPGGHMALVTGIAFSPDGRFLISSGYDKVIRVWDWQAGRTIRTLRGQVGPGSEGRVFAMALSPNGRWLAASSLTESSGASDYVIRLYDFDTRRLTRTLMGHTRSIYGVAFSPDGTRVVTASDDETLRLWRVSDGAEISLMRGHKAEIEALAVRAADGLIASGDAAGEIRLWDGGSGRLTRVLATQDGRVGPLRFSPDGRLLLSTCSSGRCNVQRVWDVATGQQTATYAGHDGAVFAAAVSPDGRLAATAGGNNQEIRVWDLQTAETRQVLAGVGGPVWAVGFSADGRRIAWGTTWQPRGTSTDPSQAINPLQFVLQLPTASQALGMPEPLGTESSQSFVRARTAYSAYGLAHRKGGIYGYNAILDITRDGKTVASIERDSASGYQHSCYTFAPDGRSIISGGSNGELTAYDLSGKRLGQFIGHQDSVWSVATSPDGRYLISGGADQTQRLWNLKTRELITTMFRGRDGEWVMWSPQGYYAGSPRGDRIVGWQINKGPASAADYVGADQLRQHMNRPDIVEKALMLASAELAVRESPGTTFRLADLLARPVPRFQIVTPQAAGSLRGGNVAIKIAIEPTPDPVKSIRLQVNARQVAVLSPDADSGGFRGEHELKVPLGRGRNEVRVTLTNAVGESAATVTLMHDGEGDLDKRGTLYIFAIGVDRYPGLGETCGPQATSACDLRYSGADARAVADALQKSLGPQHSKVVTRVLTNGSGAVDEPTAANILDGLDLLREAQDTDTIVLFIAGHGYNDGPSYRFLPTNAQRTSEGFRGATVVPWQIIQEALESAKGRRILFVDTSHSGNTYNARLGNSAYHANIVAFTSARFDQTSLEDANVGHGIFTYALLEALSSRKGESRELSTKALYEYVNVRVSQLAKAMQGEQEPQYFKGRDAEDYVLARW